jgi:ABC-type lipoprotein release transport system permease subunit
VKLCGVEDFMLQFYSFVNMPVIYKLGDMLTTIAFTITISCLAGMLPAEKAAKINPADTLRNE